MKKLFTLLLVALVGMLPMMAQTEVTATFDFTDLANLDPNPSVSPYPTGITRAGDSRSGYYYKCNGEYSVSEKGVTLTPQLDDRGFNTIAFYKKSPAYLQMATSTKLNFATEEGYTIKSITLEFNGTAYGFTTTGTGSYSDGVYTAGDDETDVTLISSATQKVSKVTVILNHAGGSSSGPEVGTTSTSSFDFQNYETLTPAPVFNGNQAGTMAYITEALTAQGCQFVVASGKPYIQKGNPSYYQFSGNEFKIESTAGYEIQSVTLTGTDSWAIGYVSATPGKMTSSGTSTTWSGDQTTSIQFKTTQGVKLLKAEVTLVYVGGDEGPHVPEALSYVLGDQTVAMTDFKAENVEIAAGSTLLFTDADGYAYGAAEAGTTLTAGTATDLTEYAPADAANANAFTVAASAIYNIAVSFKGEVPTVTLTKVSEPLVDAAGNSVATFNWALPSTLNPAVTPTFYANTTTFTANGVSAAPRAVSMFSLDSQYPNVVSTTDGTYLRMYGVSTLKVTAPAGKTILNVKIEGVGMDDSNTFTFYEGSLGTSTFADGVLTLKPTYQTNELTLEAKGAVKVTYMTVTYGAPAAPAALNYVVDGGSPVAMDPNESDNSFTATDVTIGEWGKDGSIKFTNAWMDMMYGEVYACGAATEGEVAEADKAISMVGADKLPVSAWYAYTVAPGVYTVTVSFATGMPVMTLTKTADLKQPLPTTMYAIIQGFDEPLALFAAGNSFLANDVTIGTALGQTMTIYFAESEDITDGRTYGAAEAGEAYNFNNWTNTLTEYPAGTSANRFTIPSGVYSIDVSTSGEELKVRLSKTAELAPAVLYAYDGSTLKEMTADTEAKTFTLTDYEIGAWETAGTLKFTCAFMDMAFGSTWAWGAATEGEEAEAGTAYTMTGKENMPVSEWFGYSVAGGIYTVEVSFATGSAVMTLTRTGDFTQPKPTTMYIVSDALEAPVELTLMGNSFLATETQSVTLGTEPGQTVTVYFAETATITDGRTWGAATADQAYDFEAWTNDLTEFAAGETANAFTLPSAIYNVDVNISNDTYKVRISKKDDLSGIENINAADAEVEYYNLQGVRVANPTTGVYIRVQGNKATKVSIR